MAERTLQQPVEIDQSGSNEKVEASLPISEKVLTLDSFPHDDNVLGPLPTEEELVTLPKVADSLPAAAWLVAVVELCERFTYYGISGPFQNYMQIPRNSTVQTGGLGLGQQTATALSYFFQFWCYLTPILGATISDQYLGKYKTIFWFSIIYVVGNLILFVTSLPNSLSHGAGLGGLIAAMVVIGLGTGGIKSNVAPLIADQYTNTKPYVKSLKNGRKVIVDPAVTVQSIFMIFYFCINFGSLSAIATTELERNVDFWAAYLLPFAFFFIGIIALIVGRNVYVKRPPTGSVIPNAFKVCFIGIKNKFNLDMAKPSIQSTSGGSDFPWSDLFVEEVRRSLYACKVFVFFPIYWLVYGQMVNNFISQAGQMQTHGIPNDIMQNIDPIAIIIFIPILNKWIYPWLRRIGIEFKPITRIFMGFIFAALSMAYAAIVQHLIYQAGPCYDQPLACYDNAPPNDIHVAIQTPAYVFIALSEIFASITGLEYAYTKAPTDMKSFIMALYLLTTAIGSALGIALSSVSVDPKLVWMYTGIAIATLAAGIAFWILFRKYNDIEDELNVIDAEYAAELNANITHKGEATLKETEA
jgi:proton-dependent oligopeptide transporter, POT family